MKNLKIVVNKKKKEDKCYINFLSKIQSDKFTRIILRKWFYSLPTQFACDWQIGPSEIVHPSLDPFSFPADWPQPFYCNPYDKHMPTYTLRTFCNVIRTLAYELKIFTWVLFCMFQLFNLAYFFVTILLPILWFLAKYNFLIIIIKINFIWNKT